MWSFRENPLDEERERGGERERGEKKRYTPDKVLWSSSKVEWKRNLVAHGDAREEK